METIINKAIEWFKNISESTKELTSGNVSHKACAIRGTANRGAEYLAKHKKDYSTVKWQTGEPKEQGEYLICLKNGRISTSTWFVIDGCWGTIQGSWQRFNESYIVAWCKLSDIEPYKEER